MTCFLQKTEKFKIGVAILQRIEYLIENGGKPPKQDKISRTKMFQKVFLGHFFYAAGCVDDSVDLFLGLYNGY